MNAVNNSKTVHIANLASAFNPVEDTQDDLAYKQHHNIKRGVPINSNNIATAKDAHDVKMVPAFDTVKSTKDAVMLLPVVKKVVPLDSENVATHTSIDNVDMATAHNSFEDEEDAVSLGSKNISIFESPSCVDNTFSALNSVEDTRNTITLLLDDNIKSAPIGGKSLSTDKSLHDDNQFAPALQSVEDIERFEAPDQVCFQVFFWF